MPAGYRPKSPLFVTINVTGVCNLQCRYCFNEPRIHEHMSVADYETVIEQLVDANVFFVLLSGGEPFAHPRISELLRIAHEKFSHVLTLTNGTLLKDDHLKTIRDIINEKGGFPIQISLDSLDEAVNDKIRGKAGLVKKNIQELARAGANITIAIVISRTNKNTVIPTIRELSKTVTSFHVMPIKEVKTSSRFERQELLSMDELEDTWDEVLRLKNDLGISVRIPKEEVGKYQGCASGAPCMAGFTEIVIDPNLAVRPCDRVVDCVVGDLRSESLSRIWNGDRLARVISGEVPYCRAGEANVTIASSGHSTASLHQTSECC